MVSIATLTLLLVAGFTAAQRPGDAASIEKFPSITQLEIGYGRVWVQVCVGTIITSRHVLTAAQCVAAPTVFARITRIRAGASERGRDGEILYVESILNHPDYTVKSLDNNLSLLKLASSFEFGATIQQAPVAASGTVFPASVPVVLAGWGRTAQDNIWADRDLYSVNLFTVDQDYCVSRYASLRVPIAVTENMLCTGDREGGNPIGVRDVGAPLYYDNILVGIAIFGNPHGDKIPIINTAISSYSDWIVENAV